MTMEFQPTILPGCYEIHPKVHRDLRGTFVKIFLETRFKELGLKTSFTEQFYSLSKVGVVRGLHFQVPPKAQEKVVYCLKGEVMDVAVDLRVGSPTYGKHAIARLSEAEGNGLYIPEGFAHGFAAMSEEAVLLYLCGAEYDAGCDAGIRWDSCEIPWPVTRPVMSDRDLAFPTLADFKSPFRFERGGTR